MSKTITAEAAEDARIDAIFKTADKAEAARAAYYEFLNSIDVSVAGKDHYGDLRWHVECSADQNGEDTAQESGYREYTDERVIAVFESSLATARMIVDSWQDYYPELVKEES